MKTMWAVLHAQFAHVSEGPVPLKQSMGLHFNGLLVFVTLREVTVRKVGVHRSMRDKFKLKLSQIRCWLIALAGMV